MFTGIVESLGRIVAFEKDRSNVHFTVESPLAGALKIDQSVCHDGVCLTVVAVGDTWHRVTAVEETLRRSNLGQWREGGLVNLERCLPLGGRLDGHLVQGHVDTTGTVAAIVEEGGSWRFTFRFEPAPERLLVDKGSISVNGVSLTVVEPQLDSFSVAIIPYTWEHTNFHRLKVGDTVNLEFDIIGKYIGRYMALYQK